MDKKQKIRNPNSAETDQLRPNRPPLTSLPSLSLTRGAHPRPLPLPCAARTRVSCAARPLGVRALSPNPTCPSCGPSPPKLTTLSPLPPLPLPLH